VKSVLFDFGGTLDADGTTWLERFYKIYKEAGIDVPKERFNRAFYNADDHLPARHSLKFLDLEATLRRQTHDVLEIIAPERMGLEETVAKRFIDDCRMHFNRNRPILTRLRKSYRLGIVSNFYGNLDTVLRGEELADLFDVVIDSGVIGMLKPDSAIFRHALDTLQARVEDSVMVGDSIPRDMRGAEGLEMRHILLSCNPEMRCCNTARTITTLVDLESSLS